MNSEADLSLLFLLTGTGIVTLLFASGRLNPFLDIVFAIIKCAIEAVLRLLFGWIGRVSHKIEEKIITPIRKNVHIPLLIMAEVSLLIGSLVFYLDHIYEKRIFEADESVRFYHVKFLGGTYWVTQTALFIGGFFIGLFVLYVLKMILRGLNRLLDHPVHISITVHR